MIKIATLEEIEFNDAHPRTFNPLLVRSSAQLDDVAFDPEGTQDCAEVQ